MKFTIDEKIFERFPSLHVGVVVARGIDNTGERPEVLAVLAEQSRAVQETTTIDTLKELPRIHAWKEAYAAFGAKPKKYTGSVETLYRMILEGVQLRHINTVVDIYNSISLKHTVPIGGDDLDRVDGDILLRFARGDESFIRLNADAVDHPKPGEIIYADDKEVLCRRWNWRECDKSKMTEQTKNVLLVVEGLAPVTEEDVQSIIVELGQMMLQFCGGTMTTHVLSAAYRDIELS